MPQKRAGCHGKTAITLHNPKKPIENSRFVSLLKYGRISNKYRFVKLLDSLHQYNIAVLSGINGDYSLNNLHCPLVGTKALQM